MNFIAFDLEGPLSPQDNAYDLMALLPEGRRIFEIISRYDDLLTLDRRPGYEPGDTLALIVPFLLRHGIKESDISALAARATLVQGSRELIDELHASHWQLFCITTTYLQYSRPVAGRLGIPPENVAGTFFPLDEYGAQVTAAELELVATAERKLAELSPASDRKLKRLLDRFYWQDLAGTRLGELMETVKPMGGRRKAEALLRFAARSGRPPSEWVVVGDSITDFRMFDLVEQAGGLAVAFNANEYALPYATIGLASTDISDLLPALDAWARDRRVGVARFVAGKKPHRTDDRDNFHWLAGTPNSSAVLSLHRRIRRLVRDAAAKLG